MTRLILVLLLCLSFSSDSKAQGLYPSGGYLGQPYTGGYLASQPFVGSGYVNGFGAAMGIATGAGILGAVIGSIVNPSPREAVIAQPVAAVPVAIRSKCPYGTDLMPAPTFDAYGNFTGNRLVCM